MMMAGAGVEVATKVNKTTTGIEDMFSEEKLKTAMFKMVPEEEELMIQFKNTNDAVVTQEMIDEECRLEKQMMMEMKQKQAVEQKKLDEENCFKRLRLLLSRSSIYAKFMAEKLQNQEAKEKKKMERENRNLLKVHQSNTPSAGKSDSVSGGIKRKAKNPSSSSKKNKSVLNVVGVYKKERENLKRVPATNENAHQATKSNIEYQQPKLFSGGTMRLYQMEGYEWLKILFENGVNGILADEMGLGKTIQVIALIAHLIEMGVLGPFFICGPLSTVPNWVAEFKRFTPDIPVLLYHGSKAERLALQNMILKKVKVGDSYYYPVVVTSYQIALIDAPKICRIEWKILVVDEAHRIKNFQCKLVAALKKYKATNRLLLTGTPLQNSLAELWSLLNFILPEIFDDLQVFESWFDTNRLSQTNSTTKEIIVKEQEKQIISTIHEILTPFLLRRTKAEVELGLPPKKEVLVHACLTSLQRKYYSSVLNNTIRAHFGVKEQPKNSTTHKGELSKRSLMKTNFFGVEPGEDTIANLSSCVARPSQPEDKNNSEHQNKSEIHIQMSNIEMCLRKICCHPYLISYPIEPHTEDYLVDENIVKTSGKLLVLDKLLPELQKRGHKVILFSQFVSMLRILEDYCYFRGYKYSQLDGSMNLEARQVNLKNFSEDPSTFLFLISTKAGGLGLNIVQADTVIMYDSDYNPQNDLQAQDRCHRIGQTKPVVVYRLVIPNTVDGKIIDYAVSKRKLEKAIIQKGRFKSTKGKQQGPITKETLLELLDSSDYDDLVKASDEDVLSPQELEKLLDRSDMV